jgi:putative flavoprotein involved in K+ transport
VSSAAEVIVIVIGAGQSGLAAVRALQDRGIDHAVLESGPEPAGDMSSLLEAGIRFPTIAFPDDGSGEPSSADMRP